MAKERWGSERRDDGTEDSSHGPHLTDPQIHCVEQHKSSLNGEIFSIGLQCVDQPVKRAMEKMKSVLQPDGGGQEEGAGEERGRQSQQNHLLASLDMGTVEHLTPHLHCGAGEGRGGVRENRDTLTT